MLGQLVPIFVVMGIVYILVIRPSARREKEQLNALRNVRRGDVIATNGGLIGKVTSLPTREQINLPVQEQLIVELYSK